MSGGCQATVGTAPGSGVKIARAEQGCSRETAAEVLMSEACRAVSTQKYSESAGSLPSNSTASASSPTDSTSTVSPRSCLGFAALEEVKEVEAHFEAVSGEVQQWSPTSFEFQRTLEKAARNQGHVSLMKCVNDGSFVAVKVMPISWTSTGHQQHRLHHPEDTENPWVDLGIVRHLSKKGVNFLCHPQGIFRDNAWLYCASDVATEGDFFTFVTPGPEPGLEREEALRPFMVQLFSAMRYLHDRYIAHCDISMENILVSKKLTDGHLQVKIIDFSMAVVGEKMTCGHRGKPSYQAPEMTLTQFYDPFLVDCFGMGVVLFSAAARAYPWLCTVQGRCKCFDYVREHGHRKFWRIRKVKKTQPTKNIDQCFSEELKLLVEGLLALQPSERFSIDEAFGLAWLRDGDGTVAAACTPFGSSSAFS
ncbi:par-1 [Symbiodinium necroappetens]|uniref:Par-1 protein n=1 Tax=Symbiodinium necroappetens TaxID=1628268 RepID=A0A812UAG1_9DINO|nr:par-1 [Symbiodinium necroappetens]